MKAVVVLISGVLLASPVLAQTMAGPTGSGAGLGSDNRAVPKSRDASGERTADGERRICRRLVVTGSNRPQRVCLSREQWRDLSD